jgi:hypothetical protein
LRLDGRAAVGRLDLRPRGLRRALEGGLGPLNDRVGGRGRKAGAGHPDDVGLDHHIVGAADQEQVLHIVPPEQNELPLPVQIVDVHDPKAGLPCAAAILARQHEPPAGQAAQDDAKQGDEHEDDDEGDDVLGRLRRFDTESGQHYELSALVDAKRGRTSYPLVTRWRPVGTTGLMNG